MTSTPVRHFEIQTSATVGILQCCRVLTVPKPSLGFEGWMGSGYYRFGGVGVQPDSGRCVHVVAAFSEGKQSLNVCSVNPNVPF